MNNKFIEWFTPLHVIALVLVLVGMILQFYILIQNKGTELQGVAIGFFVVGILLEVIGQASEKE